MHFSKIVIYWSKCFGKEGRTVWNSIWGKLLRTFFISMIPVLELRGALPLAQAEGLSQAIAMPVAILGNLVPVPFIIIFTRRVFAFIREKIPKLDGFVSHLENRAMRKSETVQKSLFWGLFIFVAIPLPGTGAWTGAMIAAMMNLRLRRAFPAIALGVVTAGIIMALASHGVGSLFS